MAHLNHNELDLISDDILEFAGFNKPVFHRDWRKKTTKEVQYYKLVDSIVCSLHRGYTDNIYINAYINYYYYLKR